MYSILFKISRTVLNILYVSPTFTILTQYMVEGLQPRGLILNNIHEF